MGCDIHFFVEKKVDGAWQLQGEVAPDNEGWPGFTGPKFYDGRNYNLFAILADVRNGWGFAGIKTGEGFKPIGDARGVPEDASEGYKQLVNGWGVDGHSHSHFLLRELLDYDWTQTTQLQGWCNMSEWRRWSRWNRRNGLGPDQYSGAVSGAGVKHISAEEADALFEGLSAQEADQAVEKNATTFALAIWQVPYYIAAGSFVSETIPRLLKLAGGTQHLDDVRIIFFFDN